MLETLLLFDDIRERKLARNWNTLNRWIKEEGFPPGRLIGRNRVWTEAEVMAWVESRPTGKAALRGRAKTLVRGRAA